MGSKMFKCLVGVLGFLSLTRSIHFKLMDCPVYFDEPCDANLINFLITSPFSQENNLTQILNRNSNGFPEGFDLSIPTKLIVHGYGGIQRDVAMRTVRKAYVDIGYNVILANWSSIGYLPCFITSILNTRYIGDCVGEMVFKMNYWGLEPEKIHALGFSTGAHIAGLASNYVEQRVGRKFMRITGLDPTLPFFALKGNKDKLDKTDADFVDIIHTAAGSFGKIEPTGHVDFYVNGGYLQPRCRDKPIPPLCSHFFSGIYFAETITTKKFVGLVCPTRRVLNNGVCNKPKDKNATAVIMGEHCDSRTRGTYYVEANIQYPFAISKGNTIEAKNSLPENKTKLPLHEYNHI